MTAAGTASNQQPLLDERRAYPSAAETSLTEPLAAIRQQIFILARETAEPGWDFERGRPIDAQTWRRARVFIEQLAEEVQPFPEPHISASGDGYVHIVWFRQGGDRAVLEIGRDCFWSFLSGDRSQQDREEALPTVRDAYPKLRSFLAGK